MMSSTASTILLVDHNPATRASTSLMLRAAGFAVLEATTGAEALSSARSCPDLIILDVALSEMNGFDVYSALRAMPRLARVPVVHVSSDRLGGDASGGLGPGTVGYLTHPLEAEALVGTVESFLRSRQLEPV